MPIPHSTKRNRARWLCGLAGVAMLIVAYFLTSPPTLTEPSQPSTVISASAPDPAGSQTATRDTSPAESWPEEAEPARRTGVDASNFYKNAFVLYAALTEEEKKMLRLPVRDIDPTKAALLFTKIGPILALLHQAMDADYCEWGLGELSYDTALPHISKARELGEVATWCADYHFSSDSQAALEDLAAQAKLGDNLADTLIGWLVQMNMQAKANNVVLSHTNELDEDSASQVQAWLNSSTVRDNVRRAFASEVSSSESMARKLAGTTPEERKKIVDFLVPMPNADIEQPPLLPPENVRDSAWMTAEFHYMQKVEEQMAEAMLGPREQYEAWWNGVQDEIRAQHPLAALTLPALGGLRTRLEQFQTEQAMLSAGLALVRDGSEQIASYRDPTTSQPFAYVKKADGFELQSTFKVKGRPLTMTFPKSVEPPTR